VGASGYPAPAASGKAQPTGSATKVTVLPWAGFTSALSFTFDDTNSSQISHYSDLQAENDKGNNVRYTFFLWTNKSTEMGSSVWPQALKDGHELGNHTNTHQSAANASDIQTAEDTIKSKFGVTAYSFAAPNGDASYQTVVPPMKILTTNRTAGNSGGIAMTDNPSSKQYALPCMIPATGAQTSAMTSSISSGISGGKWNIFLVHGFTGGNDSAYQPVDIAQFTGTVSWAKTQGNIWLDTVGTISAYWIGAYKFSALTATTSGTDKTWTWKTSDFATPFPPGKYLRVTTDGGVLKQGSTVLQWDDHGYYEVSLDAGTLTLSAQ
jgi:peptidoglycan/xylan/chitin deacetylase (PgdA/CDA1 family)